MAETIIGLDKAEFIRRGGRRKGFDDAYATLEWVDGFNHRRLMEPSGLVPPAEFMDTFDRKEDPSAKPVLTLRAFGESGAGSRSRREDGPWDSQQVKRRKLAEGYQG